MKSQRSHLLFAFVLSFVPSLAWADEPAVVTWAKHRVDEGLVRPLADQERDTRGFSRSRPPPRERRVRVTRASPVHDKSGRAFVPFAIDIRFGKSEWRENDVVGCVYRGSGALFVKVDDAYRPAAFLLGRKVEPIPGVCEAAPPARA